MKKLGILLGTAAALLLVSACSTVAPTETEREGTPAAGVTTLNIAPGSLRDGKVDTDYYFTLEANGVASDVKVVLFSWSFVSGASGQKAERVVNGKASLTLVQRYAEQGAYGLIATVSKPLPGNEFEILAADRSTIGIGATPERKQEILTCGAWQTANSGGYGGTLDIWHMSSIPAGAVFDLRFNTFNIPDMIVVDYPVGVLVHNTGWRGAESYDGKAAYPGGVVGSGQGEVEGVFVKGEADEFQVLVFGPTQGTAWNYDVRCRMPGE